MTMTLTAVQPDLATLRSCRENIKSHLLTLDDIYLPELKERLRTLGSQFNDADDQTRKILALTPASLQLQDMQATLASLIKDPALPAVLRPEHVAEIADYIDDAVTKVSEHHHVLSMKLDSLRAFHAGNITDLEASMSQQLDIQQFAMTELEDKRSRYEQHKQTLNAAMSVTEEKTLIDEFIPLLEAFKYLDPKNPKISLIGAAVESVQNILRIASESVKYADLVQARAKVQVELNAVAEDRRKVRALIGSLQQRIQQLSTARVLEQNVERYEQEARKICTALNTFLNGRRTLSNTNVVEHAEEFVVSATVLSDYLSDLRARWK